MMARNGKVFFAIRYAGKAIEFAKDKNAIEAGELDAQLTAAAAERGQMLRKPK